MWNLTPDSKAIEKWSYIENCLKLVIVYKSNPNISYFYDGVFPEEMEKLTPVTSVGSFFYNLTKTKAFTKSDIKQ